MLHQSHVYGIDMYACKDVFHSFRAVYICMCSFSIVNLPAAIFDAIFVVCDPPLQPWKGNSKQQTPWKSQTTHAMEIPMRVVPPPLFVNEHQWDFQPLTHPLGFLATDPQEVGFPTPPQLLTHHLGVPATDPGKWGF